jgi:hypothetical protein
VTVADIPSQFEEYCRVAEQIGYAPPKVAGILFRNYLQAAEIPIYPKKEVESYLHTRCDYFARTKGGSFHVEWVALRDQDVVSNNKAIYGETVPVEVLKLVARVETEFAPQLQKFMPNERVRYQVSTIKRDPDPFLRAKVGNVTEIIACWEEPGFSIMGKK